MQNEFIFSLARQVSGDRIVSAQPDFNVNNVRISHSTVMPCFRKHSKHPRTQGLFGKDPGIVWSRDSTKINCPRGVAKCQITA